MRGRLIPLLLLWITPLALGHDFSVTRAAVLLKADDTYVLDLHIHLDALALGLPRSTPQEEAVERLQTLSPSEFEGALEGLRALLRKRVRLRFDGEKAVPQVSFPEWEHPLPPDPALGPSVLGATARLTGRIPTDTQEVTFGASRSFNAIELALFEELTARSAAHLLVPGGDSPAFVRNLPEAGPGEGAPAERGSQVQGVTFGQYLLLGFLHILPRGLDHVLFVLGLFLVSNKLAPLLWQISMFTVAHTLTLGMATMGWVQLPGSVVEPLIALSIVYVAVENLIFKEMRGWRPVLVFAFGLLHGLGFAGVLGELGMPESRLLEALLGFNIGVEFGQLAVVAMAFVCVGWFRQANWYRSGVIVPGSLLIGLCGLYWVIERTLL